MRENPFLHRGGRIKADFPIEPAGWYWWDETGFYNGPYTTRGAAQQALFAYEDESNAH